MTLGITASSHVPGVPAILQTRFVLHVRVHDPRIPSHAQKVCKTSRTKKVNETISKEDKGRGLVREAIDFRKN